MTETPAPDSSPDDQPAEPAPTASGLSEEQRRHLRDALSELAETFTGSPLGDFVPGARGTGPLAAMDGISPGPPLPPRPGPRPDDLADAVSRLLIAIADLLWLAKHGPRDEHPPPAGRDPDGGSPAEG